MTKAPFGTHDRSWLLLRIIYLGLALFLYPLPFDVHGWGLIIPPHARTIAFVAFETVQVGIFAWAVFYWDTLPGMRFASAYMRALGVKAKQALVATILKKVVPLSLGIGCALWLITTPLEILRDAFPLGPPRFYAATAYFVIERLLVIIVFMVASDVGSDDDLGMRRRSIAESPSRIFGQRRLARVIAPPALRRYRAIRR